MTDISAIDPKELTTLSRYIIITTTTHTPLFINVTLARVSRTPSLVDCTSLVGRNGGIKFLTSNIYYHVSGNLI